MVEGSHKSDGEAQGVRLLVMNASDDYCEFCELPMSQCPHGQPPPPMPKTPVKAAPKPRKRPSTAARSSTAPERAVARRWTPPEVFKPLIITVLERSGGELEADELFLELETLAEDRLRPEDSETTPEGELRWRFAARRARVALIDEGLMTKTRPGVWQLAEPSQHRD
jgi:hypothetical protein